MIPKPSPCPIRGKVVFHETCPGAKMVGDCCFEAILITNSYHLILVCPGLKIYCLPSVSQYYERFTPVTPNSHNHCAK